MCTYLYKIKILFPCCCTFRTACNPRLWSASRVKYRYRFLFGLIFVAQGFQMRKQWSTLRLLGRSILQFFGTGCVENLSSSKSLLWLIWQWLERVLIISLKLWRQKFAGRISYQLPRILGVALFTQV